MSTIHTGPSAIGANDREVAPGTEVGEYRIEAEIGKGGFGTVYRAVHPLIGKQAAIKVLSRRYSADESIVRRFVAEAKAVNQIRHRNIIDIFAFGQLSDGRHYYIMEYLDGQPLDQHLKTSGPLALDEALPILRAIARALDAAHAKGIAHRDLKPENVFLAKDPDGGMFPKLLDFGIAKLLAPDEDVRSNTGTGVPIGTPYYMSPEQCRGKNVDARTDIYSFGVLTYRVLTGAYPFTGDDHMELMIKQLDDEPAPPSTVRPGLPAAVDKAISWMMKKAPEERPRTLAIAVAALQDDGMSATTPALTPVSGSGVEFAETRVSGPTLEASRRRWWLVALPIAAIGAGAAAFVMTRREATPTQPPVPQPQTPAAAPPSKPEHVIVDVSGAPEGTAVVIGGVKKGFTPKVQLDYSDQPVILDFEADGFQPAQATITPDHPQSLDVALKPKPVAPAPAKPKQHPAKHDRDSLELPKEFGK